MEEGTGMARRPETSRARRWRSTTCTSIYGEAHVVQGVSLSLEAGVMSVVGRNGMGKTTLCNTITGAQGSALRLDPAARSRDFAPRAAPDPQCRRRICAAGTAGLAEPQRRRAFAARRSRRERCRLDPRPRLPDLSATRTSGGPMAVRSCRAASSRCWRSRARFSPTRSSW